MTEQVTTAGEPQNADAAGTGVLDAAAQLVADAHRKMGPAPSAGEDSTEPTSAADTTGQPEGDSATPDKTGKIKRLEQENSALSKLAYQLGIDPEGVKFQQFKDGLITKEELLSVPTTKTEAAKPKSAGEQFDAFINEMEENRTKGIHPTAEDFDKSLRLQRAAMKEMQMERQIERQQSEHQNRVNSCINAAASVVANDDLHKSLPANIQQIENDFFVAATDITWARATQGDQNKLTPQFYDYYARQVLENDYKLLRQTWIDYGRNLNKPKIPSPQQPNLINPISSSEGGGPMPAPKKIIKIGDGSMAQAAREYIPTGIK